jgi:hypothetical protein
LVIYDETWLGLNTEQPSLENFCSPEKHAYILSRVLVTKTRFGLVIGFINHLKIITTIYYHTVPNFHTTNRWTLSLS